ncbi:MULTISPECIES: DUF6169 family protein [Niastella]|uniref:Uncharacterized protein n=1 Tax=Niastella soli TaxID=2821487 RepID=A0ABS3YTM7_9BACT|nr:DUF6169 family protein [Niastella soli]MBO9201204.1 hypothetical protein [Niastella soli]
MYKISYDPSSGSYHFRTENGLTFLCGFRNRTRDLSPVLGIYDIEVWEFYFNSYKTDEQNDSLKKFDKRVSTCISHLIFKFLAPELRVVLYTCDSSDGRHEVRHNLFKQWFNNLVERENYTRLPIEIDQKDETLDLVASARGGIITRKDFPHMDILQKELIDKLPDIFREKIGLLQHSTSPTIST